MCRILSLTEKLRITSNTSDLEGWEENMRSDAGEGEMIVFESFSYLGRTIEENTI